MKTRDEAIGQAQTTARVFHKPSLIYQDVERGGYIASATLRRSKNKGLRLVGQVNADGSVIRENPRKLKAGKRKRKRNPRPVEAASAGIALMRKAFTDASHARGGRMLQARISYAQGVLDGLRAARLVGAPQARVYLDGLRSLLPRRR
jgi:hypothetical protein